MIRIIIEPIGAGARGERWRVSLSDGTVQVKSSRDPEHDACRALLALGITGTLVTRWKGASHDAMRLDIERGALLTVIEGARTPIRRERWVPVDRNRLIRSI